MTAHAGIGRDTALLTVSPMIKQHTVSCPYGLKRLKLYEHITNPNRVPHENSMAKPIFFRRKFLKHIHGQLTQYIHGISTGYPLKNVENYPVNTSTPNSSGLGSIRFPVLAWCLGTSDTRWTNSPVDRGEILEEKARCLNGVLAMTSPLKLSWSVPLTRNISSAWLKAMPTRRFTNKNF